MKLWMWKESCYFYEKEVECSDSKNSYIKIVIKVGIGE